MFSDLYQSGERDWFMKQVNVNILKELTILYRTAFISPWWRKMFKGSLEKYVAKLSGSYLTAFPRLNTVDLVAPVDSLFTKNEWDSYLTVLAEQLTQAILQAENNLEKINEGYMLALGNAWGEGCSVTNAI